MERAMKPSRLMELGIEQSPAIGLAVAACAALERQLGREELERLVSEVAADPAGHIDDPRFGAVARALVEHRGARKFVGRTEPAEYRVWGTDIDDTAKQQMANAAMLPVAVSGALMPDAHVGYGLPIGGVLATDNAVIPYAVGVDIACRMRLSVFALPGTETEKGRDRLTKILERETVFGAGAVRNKPVEHEVLEEDWSFARVVADVKEKARGQLGTSGSGNHFVEWGTLTVEEKSDGLGVEAGVYLAVLSHSGSRGPGAMIAQFYSQLAKKLHPELPPELQNLAWLGMDADEGREYWAAMELMGRFAAANHAVIHRLVARALGEKPIATVENHHNFAWKERHGGREVVVHRKGATPAGHGVLGVIPGSMATPGFVVEGLGVEASLNSASHGAGRRMSRTAAKKQLRWGNLKQLLGDAKVTLLSAGVDEAPPAYKDIHAVMAAQSDLVRVLARFDPRIVRMAGDDEPPED
jgi:tRNA-splicing ligase RtcB (3'-phosphate/5'-hydroxy nucleic acid ligase)